MLAGCFDLKYSVARYIWQPILKKTLIFTKFAFIKQGDGFLKYVKHIFCSWKKIAEYVSRQAASESKFR